MHMKTLRHRLLILITIFFLLQTCFLSGCARFIQPGTELIDINESDNSLNADLPKKNLVFYLPGIQQKDQKLVNDAINARLLEKINCTLDIKVTDWNLWDSKYPILLSSGEQVDLFFTASYYGYFKEVTKNTFLPLDKLLEDFGPDIPNLLLDGYLDAARINGSLYAIPVNKDTGQGWGIVANSELANEIGTDLGGVHYLEDLEPYLLKAKEKLPDSITPLYISNELSMFQLIGSTRECATIGLSDRSRFVQLEDCIYYDTLQKKAVPIYQVPEFIEQCRLVRQWFLKGYINKDALTTQKSARESMAGGKALMHVQAQSPIHHTQWENETGKKLISVGFVSGVRETQSMTGALTALPRSCTDPERAMMIINLFMSDEKLKNMFTWGLEDKHYQTINEDVIQLPEGSDSAGDTGYNPGNFWMFGNAYLLKVWDNETPNKWDLLRVYCDTMPKSALLGFAFDSSTVKVAASAHANVMESLIPFIVNGVADIDETLKEIVKRDTAAGIDIICAEINQQVSEWKEQNGSK